MPVNLERITRKNSLLKSAYILSLLLAVVAMLACSAGSSGGGGSDDSDTRSAGKASSMSDSGGSDDSDTGSADKASSVSGSGSSDDSDTGSAGKASSMSDSGGSDDSDTGSAGKASSMSGDKIIVNDLEELNIHISDFTEGWSKKSSEYVLGKYTSRFKSTDDVSVNSSMYIYCSVEQAMTEFRNIWSASYEKYALGNPEIGDDSISYSYLSSDGTKWSVIHFRYGNVLARVSSSSLWSEEPVNALAEGLYFKMERVARVETPTIDEYLKIKKILKGGGGEKIGNMSDGEGSCDCDSKVRELDPTFLTSMFCVAYLGKIGGGDQPYRIGVMESVTGPGETYGIVAVQAKQMAVEEINAAGGVNGRMIELVVEDEKCNAQDAITAYRKLTDVDGVKIILGTSCSGAMLGVAPLAEEEGVVMFSGLATNPDIANAGDYIFRTSMSDAQVGIDTGNVLWADGVRTLATITEATDYAEGVRRTSVEQFEKRGGQIVGEERYASEVTDFRSQLTKLLNANPDGLHVAAQSEFTGGTIVKQARELGYGGPIYSDIVPIGTTALEIAGDAATGMKAITADLDPANSKAQEVLANFRQKYDYVTLPWYLGSAYDDVYITAECLKQTEDDQDADGFRDCMYDITWSGAIGDNYSFDANGEVVGLANVVVEILPTSERTEDNLGYKILGPAPTE